MARDTGPFAVQVCAGGAIEGSGTVVGPRHVLTAKHCVKEGVAVRLGERSYGIVRVTSDPGGQDVAVLEVGDPFGVPPASLASRPIRTNETFEATGYPMVGARRPSTDLEQVKGTTNSADTDDATLNLDIDSAPEVWAGMSGASVRVGGLVVGVVRGERQSWGGKRIVATPSALFAQESWFLMALGHDAVVGDLEREVDRLRQDLARMINRYPQVAAALANSLEVASTGETLATAIVRSPACAVAKAFDAADALLARMPGRSEDRAALRALLGQVLPHAVDWVATVVRIRHERTIGGNQHVLEFTDRTIAEAILAAADRRHCRFDRDGDRVRVEHFLALPAAKYAPAKGGSAFSREALTQAVGGRLGTDVEHLLESVRTRKRLPPARRDVLAAGIERRLSLDAAAVRSGRSAEPALTLVVVDQEEEDGDAAWEVVCDEVGRVLPSLRLVRLSGKDPERYAEEVEIVVYVERLNANGELS